jgi:hypothetical protein
LEVFVVPIECDEEKFERDWKNFSAFGNAELTINFGKN